MRFSSLGSGSRGNALVVEAGGTRVLLDCGFSLRGTRERLARLGLEPGDLTAIVVTHEHGDHLAGVFGLARRYALPVHLSYGTAVAGARGAPPDPACRIIDAHAPLRIGDLEIHPFPVPHDAREPLQFVFSDGRHRLGVLTDTGCLTPHVLAMLDACNALVLECNHDARMLAESDYPPSLQRRIAGRLGHLDNASAAALLRQIDTRRLQHVIAAHLSERNNLPVLARSALAAALGCTTEWIGVADQDQGFAWRSLA